MLALIISPGALTAQEAVSDTGFILNTFSFLIWGALVMWMCAGFTMLESGSVRSKNASVICLKNIGLYAIAGLAYFVIGYGLMYTDVSGFIGSLDFFYGPSADELALLGGDASATAAVVDNGYSVTSDWFFQMVFVATTASIVSCPAASISGLFAFTRCSRGIYPSSRGLGADGSPRGFVDFADPRSHSTAWRRSRVSVLSHGKSARTDVKLRLVELRRSTLGCSFCGWDGSASTEARCSRWTAQPTPSS